MSTDATLFVCSLCGLEERYRSTQKGVGRGWRKSQFYIRYEHLWYCPKHVIMGLALDQTIEVSIATLKDDILNSVKTRVLQRGTPPPEP
jgi:hypothetical protein